MPHSLRALAVTIAVVWLVGGMGALLYAQQQNIPSALAWAVLPAVLIEIAMYIATGMEAPRARFDAWASPAVRAAALSASAVLPYAVLTLSLGSFRPEAALAVAGLGAMVAFWFVLLPHRGVFDLGLLALLAAILLSKVFTDLYPRPHEKLRMSFLGQLMLFRLGILAFMLFRRVPNVRLGFLPTKREWVLGLRYFVLFIPLALAVNVWVRFVSYNPPALPWWQELLIAAGTFAGILWVVAYGEEFFFRGLLQQWLVKWSGHEWLGLAVASLLFGSLHLWYRQFPNYRFAVLASLAGVFYGLAFRDGRGVRAAMVTHALVVTAWRTFFT